MLDRLGEDGRNFWTGPRALGFAAKRPSRPHRSKLPRQAISVGGPIRTGDVALTAMPLAYFRARGSRTMAYIGPTWRDDPNNEQVRPPTPVTGAWLFQADRPAAWRRSLLAFGD